MTVEEFINSTYKDGLWKDKDKYKEAYSDAFKLSPDVWVGKWKDYLLGDKYLIDEFDKSNLMDSVKPLPERLTKYFGGSKFEPNETQKEYIRIKYFNDVPKKEFDRVLKQMKEYYDNEVKRSEERGKRNERELQVKGEYGKGVIGGNVDQSKNWGFLRNLLASDYEKERYIDDPNKAIIGADAPGMFQAPEFRTGAMGDLLAGGLAAGADLASSFAEKVPHPVAIATGKIANLLLGPGIRALREKAHQWQDSPYQTGNAMNDFIGDVRFNAGASLLANTPKIARVVRATNPKSAISLMQEERNISKGIDLMNKTKLDRNNILEMRKVIDELPDSEMKKEMESYITNAIRNGNYNQVDLYSIARKYTDELTPIRQTSLEGIVGKEPITVSPYLERRLGVYPTTLDKILFKAGEYGNTINTGTVGTAIFETLPTAANKRPNDAKRVMTPEEYDDFLSKKEMYKKLYGQDWLNYGESLAPYKKEPYKSKEERQQYPDPLWEAYIEVMENK